MGIYNIKKIIHEENAAIFYRSYKHFLYEQFLPPINLCWY